MISPSDIALNIYLNQPYIKYNDINKSEKLNAIHILWNVYSHIIGSKVSWRSKIE